MVQQSQNGSAAQQGVQVDFSVLGDLANPSVAPVDPIDDGMIDLGNGKFQLPNGHIVTPSVSVQSVPTQATQIDAVSQGNGAGVTQTTDSSARLPDGTLVSSLPNSSIIPTGYLTPFSSPYFASPLALSSGSASLTVDRAGNIFNQVYDADSVAMPDGIVAPLAGQPANINDLLSNTFSPQARLDLLKFAATNIDPIGYAGAAAQLDFDLNPSAQTQARLNEVNSPNALMRMALALPLAGATGGLGSAVLFPALSATLPSDLGAAGGYLAISGSAVTADGVFQLGNTALGNQQGWNPYESAVAAAVPIGINAVAQGVTKVGAAINEIIPDVSQNPFAPELSTGSPIAPESAAGAFGKTPAQIQTSSGYVIQPVDGQTTTILGRWNVDMDNIINTQLEYPKTADFGPKPGGYNVLNVDTTLSGDTFWQTYNKPFLDAAMGRGDVIPLATVPTSPGDVMDFAGNPTGMFGREVQYLVQNDYRPVNISPRQWDTIKGWYH